MKLREWKNGKYLPKWTVRIRWFGADHGSAKGLRLELLDQDGTYCLYPESVRKAELIWNLFKKLAPPESVEGRVTVHVLNELERTED